MKNLSVLKIFSAVIISAMIFSAHLNKVEAYEQYVGTYEDGYRCYLLTESVRGTNCWNFNCTVRVAKGADYIFTYYQFWTSNGVFYVKSSQGFQGMVDPYKTPVVYNLANFVRDNFRF